MTPEEIQHHYQRTSFYNEIQLWTFHGEGLFSDGSEGWVLAPGQELECKSEDLEFLAKAPEYIKFLLDYFAQLESDCD